MRPGLRVRRRHRRQPPGHRRDGRQVAEIFTEVICAPDYEPEALEIAEPKKNIRVLKTAPPPHRRPPTEFRQIGGGLLLQTGDRVPGRGRRPGDLDAGHRRAGADEQTLADLAFAWRAIRAVKSNAILLAAGGASVGVGMGQVNRVDSAKLAVERAGGTGRTGSVAASDAFFPFPDGFEVLAEAGVKAVVQPGGSVRDELVIEAAQKAGVTHVLHRHPALLPLRRRTR